MKIGIVGPNAEPGKIGGLETLFLNLLDSLGRFDSENEYIVYTPKIYNRKLKLKKNFRIVTPKPKFKIWNYLNPRFLLYKGHALDIGLRNFYESEDVDLLHFPFTTIHPLGIRKKKVLTFADLQQEYLPEFFSQDELDHRKRSYKPSAIEANHIISISDFTRKGLVEKYNIPRSKITTIHLTYNNELYKPEPNNMKVGNEQYFIFPAGRWKHKNHKRLIDAFSVVLKKHPGVRLKLTGTIQDQDEAISKQIAFQGIEKSVDFLGHISEKELPGLYQNAIGLVFPSLFEGFGIPVLEAMASGCPVACSNTTSLPEVGGKAVLYFDPTNIEEISNAMVKLIEDDGLRKKLRALGYIQAKKFKAERMAKETILVYESVVN